VTYYRLLADFDNVVAGSSSIFEGNLKLYWIILAAILFVLFIILVIKFYSLNMVIINASASVHENMVDSIIRYPSRFFDVNPSGILINKFSTDLGVIDNNIVFCLWESVEGPIMLISALANLCQINLYFLIPTVILSTIAIVFLLYSR
jgi:ATP-binding cassette, subfamily C (CFTR/MRP), member 4